MKLKKLYFFIGLSCIFLTLGRVSVDLLVNSQEPEIEENLLTADPPIIISNPTSASHWRRGCAYTIEWTSPGCSDAYVDIFLYYGAGGPNNITIIFHTDNDGSLLWPIPWDLVESSDYWIIIYSNFTHATYGVSEHFEIYPKCTLEVTSPTSSSSWQNGTSQSITWTSENCFNRVDIELYKDGTYNRTIVTDAVDTGSYSWDVPSDLTSSSFYQIRISEHDYGIDYDFSPYFEITHEAKQSSNDDDDGDDDTTNGDIVPLITISLIIGVASSIPIAISAVKVRKRSRRETEQV